MDLSHVKYTDGSYEVWVERRALQGAPGWAPVRYVSMFRRRGVRGASAYPWISPLADEAPVTADDFDVEWELAEE